MRLPYFRAFKLGTANSFIILVDEHFYVRNINTARRQFPFVDVNSYFATNISLGVCDYTIPPRIGIFWGPSFSFENDGIHSCRNCLLPLLRRYVQLGTTGKSVLSWSIVVHRTRCFFQKSWEILRTSHVFDSEVRVPLLKKTRSLEKFAYRYRYRY